MKKIVAVFCLLLCAATLQAKDKPNPADFPIKIHIFAAHYTASSPSYPFTIDAVLNGKKVQLGGAELISHGLFSVINSGDYQIRLRKDESEKDGSIIRQEYELLLPNGDIWYCYLIGISE